MFDERKLTPQLSDPGGRYNPDALYGREVYIRPRPRVGAEIIRDVVLTAAQLAGRGLAERTVLLRALARYVRQMRRGELNRAVLVRALDLAYQELHRRGLHWQTLRVVRLLRRIDRPVVEPKAGN